jgi:hypothetical protein
MSAQDPETSRTYFRLLQGAFDELHSAVVEKVNDPSQYVGTHQDYPRIGFLDSAFPYFTEMGFYDQQAPRDYVGVCKSPGFFAAFSYAGSEKDFPIGSKLVAFLESSPIGERFRLGDLDSGIDIMVSSLMSDCVERYLQIYGTGELDKKRRDETLRLVFVGTTSEVLQLRLVVPIALTHFDIDHFRLDESAYITRLSRPMKLSRSRISSGGSGAVRNVIGAATHAFVSTGWSMPNTRILDVKIGLSQPSSSALEFIDRFFASMRIATGITTGYAQVLFTPSKWATGFFCDLPPVFGGPSVDTPIYSTITRGPKMGR